MANYNSSKLYNHNVAYNSASYSNFVTILDSGYGTDDINNVFANLDLVDNALGSDAMVLIVNVETTDISSTLDSITISSYTNISDNGACNDVISSVQSSVSVSENSSGVDNIGIASSFFSVDRNNILQPLGVLVLRDSRYEIIPSTKDISEEIPGMHGEIDFGTEFKTRNIELHVVTNNGYAPLEKSQLQRLFAMYLDPTKGAKTLTFSDDIEKTYTVKFSGKIDPTMYATWFEFTLPFKMSNPFINGSFEKTLVGSGTIVNGGTFETPMIIEITGSATNPSVTIGTKTLSYSGTISSDQMLIINTELGTAILNGANALSGISGELSLCLQPGNTNVTTNSNTTIRWRDRWI